MRGDGELEFLLQSDIGRILAVPDLSPARRSTDVDKGDPQAVAFPMAAQGFLRNPMLLRELGDFRFNFLHQKRRSMAAHCLALEQFQDFRPAARVLPLPRQPHQFAQDHIGVQKNIHLKQGDVVAK